MANRTIVFIAGADFSGTTMLDLTLGSLPGCKSLGEVHSFFRPTVPEQKRVICSCGRLCDFWIKASVYGAREFYSSVFRDYPDVRILIDSSKSIPWINEQTERLLKMGYRVKHLLVWKDVDEYRISRQKRGRGKGWARSWIRYHRAYLSWPREFFCVKLKDLLNGFDSVAGAICEWLGVEFEPGIREYWKSEHHIVFGSATARLKLHPKGSSGYYTQTLQSSKRKDINPSLVLRKTDTHGASEPRHWQSDEIKRILRLLEGNGVKKSSVDKLSARKDLFLYKLKSLVKQKIFRFRYGNRRHLIDMQQRKEI